MRFLMYLRVFSYNQIATHRTTTCIITNTYITYYKATARSLNPGLLLYNV
jgi:hypothetical protein